MEHLLKITKGLELADREYVTLENMRFLRRKIHERTHRPLVEWDNAYMITGFILTDKNKSSGGKKDEV